MKKNLLSFMALAMPVMFFSSCSKSSGEDATDAMNLKAKEFETVLQSNKYRLVDFYSDKPVDYYEGDTEVKAETDLRAYIKPYLVDDENVFSPEGGLKIVQNAKTIPGDETSILNRNYNVSSNSKEVMLTFVDYMYSPANYKVSEFTASGFTLYMDWPNGAKLYSKFQSVN
ncbi:MAG: hypothetical protein H7Y31_14250 [Chitinophagaceae bacterium]|nr:hypothetical protein [Chitinophagaceae bacterium]